MVGLVGCPTGGGGGSAQDAREFSEICKKFLKKIELFVIQKNLKNPSLNFSAFGRKHKWSEYLEKFFLKIQYKNGIITILGKVLAKNRTFGNTILLNNNH